MKTYIILLFSFINILNTKAQNINDLMSGFDNTFAAEHLEMYTRERTGPVVLEPNKDYISSNLNADLIHQSIRFINLNSNWLESITFVVKKNPESIFPFLDTKTHNLAAYLLLSHIFEIDIPDNSSDERSFLNLLLPSLLNEESLNLFKEQINIPTGEDPSKYVLNTLWASNETGSIASARIKEAVKNR